MAFADARVLMGLALCACGARTGVGLSDETNPSAAGGSTIVGGATANGNGGATANGNGGATANGNGGATANGNGGATANGNGGATANGNGGATASGNGGATASSNGGATASGGATTGVRSISAGFAHACAVTPRGEVKCWGSNTAGQIVFGGLDAYYLPIRIKGIDDAVAVSVDTSHGCALLGDTTVKCWSSSSGGQPPVTIAGLSGVTQLAVAGESSCVIATGGTVRCWDAGWRGDDAATPTEVPLSEPAAFLAVGPVHACALLRSGVAECWGSNNDGQFGSDAQSALMGVPFAGGVHVTALGVSGSNTCVNIASSGAGCLGLNEFGGLGDGATWSSRTLVPLEGNLQLQAFSSGNGLGDFAIDAQGRLITWGAPFPRGTGRIGDSAECKAGVLGACLPSSRPMLARPQVVADVPPVRDVALGGNFGCVLLRDGGVRCWGLGEVGQLGNGSSANSWVPTPVLGI
ncbi:MAG: hypothetical protein QM756_27975 [Polyangiaceae bacterium]